MEARNYGDVSGANVVGELRGSMYPDEFVVIGGHIDSWDVGQGAHDDGAGVIMAMEALNVLRKLGLRPKRTIRVVLFTAEEVGLHGGRAYAADHAGEMGHHVAAIEADIGCHSPIGYGVDCQDAARLGKAAERRAQRLRVSRPRSLGTLRFAQATGMRNPIVTPGHPHAAPG